MNNSSKKQNYIDKWKKIIAKKCGVDEDIIYIDNLRRGSITFDLMFKTEDFTDGPCFNKYNFNFSDKIKNLALKKEIKVIYEKSIVERMKLTPDMLDSRGNNCAGGWAGKGETRGGKEYFPPDDSWIGYGLKVLDCYEDNDWIAMNGNPKEWAVAYHGTVYHAVVPICKGKFWSTEAEGAYGQYCKNKININPYSKAKYKICGEGAYCSPHLDYANNYRKDNVIIMCRVNTKKMRIPEGYEENEWIIDGTKDTIRPYRILVKKNE